MAQKPSIPKGTRDFSPAEMIQRNYIFNTITKVFQKYGFYAIETPAMENLSTLMGKYGEEGDKLLFKILNSGNYLSKIPEDQLSEKNHQGMTPYISEKGLRYDLTVPFARYVVQHRNELTFPFRRYQIQPVWRADKPQKGRYREFYQCDVDVIGSNSLLNEVELVQIIDEIFKTLKIDIEIKINNRKILAGIAEFIGEKDRLVDITVAIDKLDKIGLEKVNNELAERGLAVGSIKQLQPVLQLEGSVNEKLQILGSILQNSDIGKEGIEEINTLFSYLGELGLMTNVSLDLTLARGLNYYTGAIFEVKAKDISIGSICGGGRYDNLTGIFGLQGVSGVGVSFGAERIYDVLTSLNLFPDSSLAASKVLFVNFGGEEEVYCLKIISQIREKDIKAEIFPNASKMKKQLSYANKNKIPFVVLAGEDEIKNQKVTLKDMKKGTQELLGINELVKILKS